jgi:localization factor PodJL
MLGVSYATSLGLPRDSVAAHMWLTLAARQNEAEAIRLRDALARKMSRAEIDQAAARAQRWRPAATTRFADQPTVRFAQVTLTGLGFDPGPADGQMGQRTHQALAAYQAKAGLRGDGALTEVLLQRLKADGTRSSSLATKTR